MLDDMITVKTLVHWFPAGRNYQHEFGPSLRTLSASDKHGEHNESWLIRSSNEISEELYVCDRTVILTSNTEISNRFPKLVLQTSSPVTTACWASFLLPSAFSTDGMVDNHNSCDHGRVQKGIAVLEAERLTFIDTDGEQYVARLPCRLAAAWSLDMVMLLERQPSTEESVLTSKKENHQRCVSPGNLFTIFSLHHPLDEVAPVLLKVPLPAGGFGICFVSDVNLKIVAAFSSFNMVLTRYCDTGVYSLWRLEKALPEDYVHLYEIGEDGRACVAPWALNRFAQQTQSFGHDTPVAVFTKRPDSSTTGRQGCEQSRLHESPLIQATSTKVCLSPFNASLIRLLDTSRLAARSLKVDSPLVPPGSPVIACPLTPVNLASHIDRLSSVAPLRPCFGASSAGGRRPSVVGSGSKPTPTYLNRTVLSHSLVGPNTSPTVTRRVSLMEVTRDDTTQASSFFNRSRGKDILDEPLLPKVCLRLIWTERPCNRLYLKSKFRLRWNSNARDEEELKISRSRMHQADGDLIPLARDTKCTEAVARASSDVPSRFLVANKRILDLSQPSLSSSEVRLRSPLTSKSVGTSLTLPSVSTVSENPGEQNPNYALRSHTAFFALDMVSVPWICFLVPEIKSSSHSTQLACIRAETLISSKHCLLSSAQSNVVEGNSSSSQLLHFLPAIDAVYVPTSRLTVCLDPNTGIVLYTGTLKVCILGISPPPVFGAYSASTSSRFMHQRRQRLSGSSFGSPFVIRPTSFDLDQWNQNSVPAVLTRVESTVTRVLIGDLRVSEPSAYKMSEAFMCEFREFRSVQDSITLFGAEACVHTSECSTAPIDSSCTVRDACGNAFTLSIGCDSTRGMTREMDSDASEQFLRVYLPPMAEDELVQRCLAALKQSLPHQVSLLLLSRWYSTINAPGTHCTLASSNPLQGSTSSAVSGSLEWVRFAQFLLQSCGFITLDDDLRHQTEYNVMESVASHSECSVRSAKRQCAVADDISTWQWDQLRLCTGIGNDLADPSLFPSAPSRGPTVAGTRYCSVRLSATVRTDASCRVVLRHLPTILMSLHLVYEEAKLNCVLIPRLHLLAELNILLSRILRLTTYSDYYYSEWPELITAEVPLPVWTPALDEWSNWSELPPSNLRPPCLLSWLIECLERPADFLSPSFSPTFSYVHLPYVNDLATTFAGMMLAALYTTQAVKQFEHHGKPDPLSNSKAIEQFLSWWRGGITQFSVTSSTSPNLNAPATSAHSDSVLSSLDYFSAAFVKAMLSVVNMPTFEDLETFTVSSIEHSLHHTPHNTAVIFLSNLDEYLVNSHSSLSIRLRTLPSGLSTILHLVLSRSRANPPPNCAPNVYMLMGRHDLACHGQLSRLENNGISKSSSPSTSDPPVHGCNFGQSSSHGSFRTYRKTLPCVSSPLTERWASTVRPLREAPVGLARSHHPRSNTHALLHHLESNPAIQVAFKDDLRLREAYRLLQATSHIPLPRLTSADNTSGVSPTGESTDEQGSRLAEPRLEMHLAAAGVRVWASAIGRGMLGLGCLFGSHIPIKLRVPPICLRGRAVSPCSGRHVLVDLARDSLPSTSSAGAGATTVGTVHTGMGNLEGTTRLISDTLGADRRIPIGNGIMVTSNELTVAAATEVTDASDHPGNSLALAIASAVAANDIGAALKTASLDLARMLPRGQLATPTLAAIAANSASSTASLLSTANLQQIPAVLAAKHWPDFHNGVAVGLCVAPHASIDAAWIMYNCRSAGTSASDPRSGNRPPTRSQISPDMCTPEQAGLLLGLGLNGHLNKLTPYDIGEYLVRVQDLHNMAVLLGLCAGKRGSMDQSVLRLLAVHYRPLLPSDPLVHVQLSVPSLCQAAAVFGLGLLYEGSAHRHITNLLITELGRPLNGHVACGLGRKGLQVSGHDSNAGTNATNLASNTGTTTGGNSGWTGAAGAGGLAGDSCELIALSAGLALGLVLLQRADTPCGLSDLPWAERLHAYMVGSPRVSERQCDFGSLSADYTQNNFFSDQPTSRLLPQHTTSGPLNRIHAIVNSTIDNYEHLNRSSLSDACQLSIASGLLSLHDILISDEVFSLDTPPSCVSDSHRVSAPLFTPTEPSRAWAESVRASRTYRLGGSVSSATAVAERLDLTGQLSDRRAHSDVTGFPVNGGNSQIRELNCYNTDVSAPGATMALGMAYLGSENVTISSWLVPPSSLAQLESIRPDFLMFRAIAHGLVNWHAIKPTWGWIHSFIPSDLLKRLVSWARKSDDLMTTTMRNLSEFRTIDPLFADLPGENYEENRCPDLPMGARYLLRRSDSNTVSVASTAPSQSSARRGGRSTTRRQLGSQTHGLRVSASQPDSFRCNKWAQDLHHWQEQFFTDSTSKVDEEAISLAYLNILVGRSFALGLRYAGTSLPAAVHTLFEVVQSILNGSWWPPVGDAETNTRTRTTRRKILTPKPTLEIAVAHCLLSLSMVLSGSGNLTVLRLVRQLRAIRLFRAKSGDTHSGRTPTSAASDPDNCQSSVQPFTSQPRLNAVAVVAARAAANSQATSTSTSSGLSSGPISVAAVFGATLGPSFGVQMVYGCIVGLLFLGGGRLTLSNTPEAAAILSITFLPIMPNHAGDNWYHLQALRHLYVLASRPRRLCAVDVDTGRVTLSNMRAKLSNKPEFISSKDTFVFPTNSLNELAWVEINHGSDEYWPTVFRNGTVNWEYLKRALHETGYIFVKKRDATEESMLLESLEKTANLFDLQVLQQIKVIVAFIRHFPCEHIASGAMTSGKYDPGRVLASAVTRQFVSNKHELSRCLRNYYFTPRDQSLTSHSRLLDAFRLWFCLPPSSQLSPYLNNDAQCPTFAQFMKTVQPVWPVSTPLTSLFWLYSFLYTDVQTFERDTTVS